MRATVFKNCPVVCGDQSSDGRRLQSTEIHIPALNKWQRMADLNMKRFTLEVVAYSDCLHAMGGYVRENDLSSVERMWDLNGEWELIAPMSHPRSLFCCCELLAAAAKA